MKQEILKQVITQIKKYELTELFKDKEKLQNWLSKLNDTQINNFLNLDLNPEEVQEVSSVLINLDLLNCEDYQKKVLAISTLKNTEGCWPLLERLCRPNFLKSKNFYKDIDMLSKADTARYGLWIIGEDAFINSPYHDEDLKLLVETHDSNEENSRDFIVSDALATVAGNSDSINSPYHRQDMNLIASSGSECLQSSCSYPKYGLNNLAANKVSLNDPYHLENMQILSTNPIASRYLYEIMTNHKFVEGKNYRHEVNALLNAKSDLKSLALYYYIVNPEKKGLMDYYDAENFAYIPMPFPNFDKKYVSGSVDPEYLNNLIKINELDDFIALHYVALLMNPDFIISPNKNFDLELLKSITNKDIISLLYGLMLSNSFLTSPYHQKDAILISETKELENRILLFRKADNKVSINSPNHEYDMEYISKLNLNSLNKNIYEEIQYYLFNPQGINNSHHQEKLEKLSRGIMVERSNKVADYLDELLTDIENGNITFQEKTKQDQSIISKPKSKILSLIKKYIK